MKCTECRGVHFYKHYIAYTCKMAGVLHLGYFEMIEWKRDNVDLKIHCISVCLQSH